MMFKFFIVSLIFQSTSGFLTNPFASDILEEIFQALESDLDDGSSNIPKTFTPGVECNRKCDHVERKICYFEWVLEMYPAMSGACMNCSKGVFEDCFHPQCVTANGHERTVVSINRQLPAPPIEVCKNDIIVVDIMNDIEGGSTTIHWHGYSQKKHPFMDGVPWITQCPIHFGSTFRYTFEALQVGTYFFHSHAGHQKANGAYGALIIKNDEMENLFDYDLSEHVIILSDWMNEMTENTFPGLLTKGSHPEALLINGRGRYLNKQTKEFINAPISAFHVDEGKKYKFRLIGASSNVCPLQIEFEDHNFTVIASDATRVKPFTADRLYITSGERYDIIINADKKNKNSFWIRTNLADPCINDEAIEEFAVLRYHRNGFDGEKRDKMVKVAASIPDESLFTSVKILNSPFMPEYSITSLESYIKDDDLVSSPPVETFNLFIGTPLVNDVVFSGQMLHKYMVTQIDTRTFNLIGAINLISFAFPEVPLLSQHEEIDENIFCNETHRLQAKDKCYDLPRNETCFCTHRLVAPEHSIVEFIITTFGLNHPFHLHGYPFAVMEVGVFNETFTEDLWRSNLKATDETKRNPVYKDTVFIPPFGYARLRYRTHSASVLFFHCHYDSHLQIGMAGILQVGSLKDLPKPPENFPQCRNYLPK